MTQKAWLKFWQDYRNIEIANDKDLLFQVGKTVMEEPINKVQFDRIISDIVNTLEIESNDNILDLCCGNGVIPFEIAKHSCSVLAIDFSETMIKNAKKYKSNTIIEYLQHDINNILELQDKIQEKKINKVILYDALAYFSRQDFVDLLATLDKLLYGNYSILIGSVLLKENKWDFYNTFARKLNYLVIHRLLGKNRGLGKWWKTEELNEIAKSLNYKIKILDQNPVLYSAHYRVDVLFEK